MLVTSFILLVVAEIVNNTIWLEAQGKWNYGSARSGLAPKWVNEVPVYSFRDRSVMLPEAGSPASLTIDPGLVSGFVLGVAASLVANYLYKPKGRKR